VSDVPHFSLPFRFATPQAAVSEQDTVDEVGDCILSILVCPVGFRVELPTFGTPDPTFESPIDLDAIQTSIETWEPRAAMALTEQPDLLDVMVEHLELRVQVRTEE
jgi:phage baseplate assembly protein W